MNTPRQLLKRTLRLYPIKSVKETFNATGKADEVIEMVSGNYQAIRIKDFARDNFFTTKQHIYVKTLQRTFNPGAFDRQTFPYTVQDLTEEDNFTSVLILPKVKYSVILTNPYAEDELHFYQPVLVRILGRLIIYHFIILEKNISHHYIDRLVLKAEKDRDEKDFVATLDAFFIENYHGIGPTDLNAGTKHLWENDVIDCKDARWRSDKSIDRKTMDENFTVKEEYPEKFEELMGAPLEKSIFVYLREDEQFPEHFTIDARNGFLSIPIFPDNPQQIKNVIREILENN